MPLPLLEHIFCLTMNGPLPAELKFWVNTDCTKCLFHSLQETRRKKKKKRTHTSDAVVSIFNLSKFLWLKCELIQGTPN